MAHKKRNFIVALGFLILSLMSGCCYVFEDQRVGYFKQTEAYDLAKAVECNNTSKIERIVKENPALMEVHDPVSSSNALVLAITLEQFDAFKKLLELGSNPNWKDPRSKRSPLIESIKWYGTMLDFSEDTRYAELLLQKGADPNYGLDSEIVDSRRITHSSFLPIIQASRHHINYVKLLLRYGADPHKKLKLNECALGEAAFWSKYDIVNFLIDSCKVNVLEPVGKGRRYADLRYVDFYIQDELLYRNEYLIAVAGGDTATAERILQQEPERYRGKKELWELVDKLKRMGVDFKNHEYIW